MLDVAVVNAVRLNDFKEMSELLDFYPPLPLNAFLLSDIPSRVLQPPLLVEKVPEATLCGFNVGPIVNNCIECIPGLLTCAQHLILCGEQSHICCSFCFTLLCVKHGYCSCSEAINRR